MKDFEKLRHLVRQLLIKEDNKKREELLVEPDIIDDREEEEEASAGGVAGVSTPLGTNSTYPTSKSKIVRKK